MSRGIRGFWVASAVLASWIAGAEPFLPGEISPNFTLPDREGNPVQLTDYKGHIVVLDFFAFWCAPCSVSSPDIEESIQKYYEAAGGNPDGIPVQVLSINLEQESEASTNEFIVQADLDRVVNDFDQTAWNLYNRLGSRPSIPLFVIINGVTDSDTHRPWEILHSQHGMYILPNSITAKSFRTFIDAVERSSHSGPPINPFESLVALTGGWKQSEWFGRLNDRLFPWVYHEKLGWLYIRTATNAPDGLYFFQPLPGWRYTSPDEFPQAYDFSRDTWIQFDLNQTETLASFYDYSLNQWVDSDSNLE